MARALKRRGSGFVTPPDRALAVVYEHWFRLCGGVIVLTRQLQDGVAVALSWQERIRGANLESLEHWFRRAIVAPDLPSVFNPPL